MAFVNSLSATFSQDDPGLDIRRILGKAREAVKESVKHKMRLFGSDGKA
jgi:fructose/tagatose bisphosphate aldolase